MFLKARRLVFNADLKSEFTLNFRVDRLVRSWPIMNWSLVDLELLWLGNSIFVRKSLININIESLLLDLHDNLWPPGSSRKNSSTMNRIRARDGSSLIEWWNLTCRVNWFYKNHENATKWVAVIFQTDSLNSHSYCNGEHATKVHDY